MKKNKTGSLAMACMSAAFGLIAVAQASATDAPARKPGLWEVKTDQMLQSSAGPFSAPACAGREVKTSDSGMTIDSRCSFNGKAASAHADITGNFDSAY